MLDFEQILAQYPQQLRGYTRAILREYLQVKILQGVFESKQASQVSFIGGTALRIMHDNQRFSEDIDLDHFGMDWSKFDQMIHKVARFMKLEGFEVEINSVTKGAYHCYLRFPDLLYAQGLSPHLVHIPVKPTSDSGNNRPPNRNNKTGQHIVHQVDDMVC